MPEVLKSSPEGLLARAEWLLNVGYDIAAVMNDHDWRVMLVDGYPEIALNAEGARKMALLAPSSGGRS